MEKKVLLIGGAVIFIVAFLSLALGLGWFGGGGGGAKPHYTCTEEDEACMNLWEAYSHNCTRSLLTLDSRAIGYDMDINGQVGSKCSVKVTVTKSPYDENLVGSSMSCSFPMQNGVVTIDTSESIVAFTDYCKGPLKDTLVKIMSNVEELSNTEPD